MDTTKCVAGGMKRQAFFGHLRATEVLPNYHLLRIVMDKNSYQPRMRAAALRHLIARSPIDVTQGRPFAERRLLVRTHYEI